VTLLADVVDVLDGLWPAATAEPSDAVGPVCGDPHSPVRRVLFAVDPVDVVVDEALEWGAQLVVTHHPLYLSGTTSVYGGSPKGGVVQRLVAGGSALFVAHTNADVAVDGVSAALADAIGLVDATPLRPSPPRVLLDRWVVYVPGDDADAVLDAMVAAGAGQVADYERCAFSVEGTATFLPRDRAEAGARADVAERRLEVTAPRALRAAVAAAVVASHPYEAPVADVLETVPLPDGTGLGRVGQLPRALPLAEFAARVAAQLPATAGGVRVAGDPQRLVHRVAVCGGAGDSLLSQAAAAGVDAYVTGDLRHHRASESLGAGLPALVDPGHWASEWPWLPRAAAALAAALGPATVETRVSARVTDPWTLHVPTREESR